MLDARVTSRIVHQTITKMSSDPVAPLRIQKSTPSSSPTKIPTATSRPLAELSPMGIRRNSPSFPQTNKGSVFKSDSSPFDSSPFSNNTASPRAYWQGREPTASPGRLSVENRNLFGRENTSPVCAKRSSIENLKKASRVKNSSMFEREHKNEYDPNRVTPLERPLASGRPLSMQFQGNAFAGRGAEGWRKSQAQDQSPQPTSTEATFDPASSTGSDTIAPLSPSKNQRSPTKSSLSKKTGMSARNMGFDPETGIWSEDDDTERKKLPEGRSLHRHAKSVTFDQAPPQINEYEMTTPDPSSVASGSREGSYDSHEEFEEEDYYERGSSMDHDDSFDASLEDTEKTPVVLPEDWRFMSPDRANDELAKHEEDPFNGEYGSPEPTAEPGLKFDNRPHQTSVTSVDSNGHARPLPPLPGLSPNKRPSYEANKRLSGTLERVSSAQRNLPSPPLPAPISKSDLKGMGRDSMSLEDRLRLMMSQETDQEKTEAEKQRERRMRRANSKERSPVHDTANPGLGVDMGQEDTSVSEKAENSLAPPPRISRESILAKIRGLSEFDYEDNYDQSSPAPSSSPERPLPDPDVPIPSLEDDAQNGTPNGAIVKEEPEEADLYSITDFYSRADLDDANDDIIDDSTDDESHYSQASLAGPPAFTNGHVAEEDGQATPRANSPSRIDKNARTVQGKHVSLPAFANFNLGNDFGLGLKPYMTPSPPPESLPQEKPSPAKAIQREEPLRPTTPELQAHSSAEETSDNEPGTPDSVIHHSLQENRDSDTPPIEEASATIKAPGSHLKTRPSLTPADLETMAATRRRVSDQSELLMDANETDHARQSLGEIANPAIEQNSSNGITDKPADGKRVSSLVQLEIPSHDSDIGLGLGLDKEFDRVIEAQKRGYLMRQNTKVVVASNRHDDYVEPTANPINETQPPAATSPRKPSQQTWTTEPWNGKTRRKSIRTAGGSPRKRPFDGPAPPLPGQSSVQEGLDSVAENEAQEEEELPDDGERGRVFVKVVGVKELDLPLPTGERSYFALTLDNGLHCVTTSWLELGRTAPIGQEFELVVLNDLEFQLTLQMKLDEPRPEVMQSPIKAAASPKKQSTFSRVFGSPKKRKEAEAKMLESRRSKSPIRQQQPSLYDIVEGLVARDGSFARAYVSLSEYEKRCFGRPYTVDITCFNEWAMEQTSNGSNRSKKGLGMQRRPPYKVGKLELQLLYVPKPKGARDEDMPKSMNACIREMREAEVTATAQWEGFLSQQGGDCPYWRRRFFKMNGTKLTAFHESTLQPRANINLSKAVKVIDDKSSLTKKETSTKGGGRRKSGFAEEEEGYMFVEEGFRIRFANGEVIDFYADSREDKEGWMRALSETVGKTSASSHAKAWTELVLKHERAQNARKSLPKPMLPDNGHRRSSKQGHHEQMYTQSTKNPFGSSMQPPPVAQPRYSPEKTQAHQYRPGHSRTESHQAVPTNPMKDSRPRHQKTRSMADVGGLQYA